MRRGGWKRSPSLAAMIESPNSIEISDQRRRSVERAHALYACGANLQIAYQVLGILEVGIAAEFALDPIGVDAHLRRAPENALRYRGNKVDDIRRCHAKLHVAQKRSLILIAITFLFFLYSSLCQFWFRVHCASCTLKLKHKQRVNRLHNPRAQPLHRSPKSPRGAGFGALCLHRRS